jgi:hypothetical protein
MWNQDLRGHEMAYLASGVVIGALGASLVLGNSGAQRRLTQAFGAEPPRESGSFLWPWGALIAGGCVAAGVASMAPEIARYIKIEMM